MSWPRRRRRQRSLWRSLVDGAIMLALLLIVGFFGRETGVFPHETGGFTAIDGDSLRKGEQDYRLHAIDAPELRQTCQDANGRDYPCGREARDALRRLVASAPVTCQLLDKDRYGRRVAACRAGDLDINDAMVRSGWAIAYRRHGSDYIAAENKARKARRGVWQGRFQPPEEYRRSRRERVVQGALSQDADEDD